jgi:DNA-binding NtrC family response regulator
VKPRILIIDDEAAIRDSLRMILEYEHYECFGAASGPDGLSAIGRDAPDLVILDIKMPGMNGLDTLAEIRKADATVPVAMISGHGTITDAVQATRLGAFDFIEKPFTSERVLVRHFAPCSIRSGEQPRPARPSCSLARAGSAKSLWLAPFIETVPAPDSGSSR